MFLDLKDIRFAGKSWEEQYRLVIQSIETTVRSNLLMRNHTDVLLTGACLQPARLDD
jgi:hypothetical protein